jgi:catechol-2,3-dioxygenase
VIRSKPGVSTKTSSACPWSRRWKINESKTGRATQTLHTFYRLADGSHLAFFESRELPFEFKKQHDFDLHIALEVDAEDLQPMLAKGRELNIEVRGPSDHGMIDSIYFRDPDGYVIELCAKRTDHDTLMDPARNGARDTLQRWTAAKSGNST